MPHHEAESPLRPKLEATCHQVSLLGGDVAFAAVHFGAAANMICNCPECPDLDECQAAWEDAAGYFEDVIKRATKIRTVCLEMAGEKPGAASTLANEDDPDLTERELEVCRLIALGYSTREAAEELGVSTRTVDGYRARLNEKLGFESRRDLVAFALKHRIIS